MKIIHLVLGKANPERMNGVNKVAYELASNQTKLGYDVMLWGIANSLKRNYPPRNFPTELFNQKSNKFQLDEKLKKAIKELPDDTVIHIHGAFIPEFYKVTRILKKMNIPYIYTPHGSLTEMAMTKNKWAKKIINQQTSSFPITTPVTPNFQSSVLKSWIINENYIPAPCV